MVRFLHTADWHIGRAFARFPSAPRELLREARLAAVARLATIAREAKVDAVLVAGDIFDDGACRDATIIDTLAVMAGFSGPWLLLPGNHDAFVPGSAWDRLSRLGASAAVRVASAPEPIHLAEGPLVVLPAPLTARHVEQDLTVWMERAATPVGAVRVGLAHGSMRQLIADGEAPNPIAPNRAATARLDYLALGDWHGTREIDPRTHYAGTPEPDGFKANDPGNVLLVEIDRPGAEPRVTRIATARHLWHAMTLDLTALDATQAETAVARLRERASAGRTAIVRLSLSGLASLAVRESVGAAIELWRGALCHLEIDDTGFRVEPTPDELAALDTLPVLKEVAAALNAHAVGTDAETAATARLALQLLWRARPGAPARA